MGIPTTMLDAALALGIDPATGLSVAQAQEQVIMSALTIQVVPRETGKHREAFNPALAKSVRKGKRKAILEAQHRLQFARLRPNNRRALVAALDSVGAPHTVPFLEVEDFVPAPTPTKAAPCPAATIFAARVKELADDGDRIRLGMRASKLARQKGWSTSKVLGLSDEEILALVAAPVR